MWITYCFLAEIVVLRAGSSITQHAFHYWCQFWYSPSGTIENSAPLCFRTIGSLQKKDTKCERAKLIPFQLQPEQKHSGMNILPSWGGQNQYSDLCDVAFYGLSLRLYPNFCKDDPSLFCSSEMPSHVYWSPSLVWAPNTNSVLGRDVVGYGADPWGSVSSSGCWFEGIRLTSSDVWMKMCIYSIHVYGLLSRMVQLLRKCWCLIALTSNSPWGFANLKVGLWLKVRLLFLYQFSEKLTVNEHNTIRRCLITL